MFFLERTVFFTDNAYRNNSKTALSPSKHVN